MSCLKRCQSIKIQNIKESILDSTFFSIFIHKARGMSCFLLLYSRRMIKALVLLCIFSLSLANEIEVEGNVPEDRIIGRPQIDKRAYLQSVLITILSSGLCCNDVRAKCAVACSGRDCTTSCSGICGFFSTRSQSELANLNI